MPRDGGMKTGLTWWNTFLVHVKQTLEWVQRGVFSSLTFLVRVRVKMHRKKNWFACFSCISLSCVLAGAK